MQLKDLLKVIQKEFVVITIAYATTGHRLFKGSCKELENDYLLNFYVTLLIPGIDKLYIEVHENKNFLED